MATDKNTADKTQGQQQPTQTQQGHTNPFGDADRAGKKPTPEEEAALEQQRKEALTERD